MSDLGRGNRLAAGRLARGGWPAVVVLLIGLPPLGLLWMRPQPEPSPTRPSATRPAPGGAGLFVVGADGQGLRVVAPPGDFERAAYPCWSPDGAQIAFTAFDPTGRSSEVRIVAAGGGATRIIGRGVGPSWSRDGTRLAVMVSGELDIATDWSRLGRNHESVELLTPDPAAPEAPAAVEALGPGLWPRFAPTDDRLAFVTKTRGSWDVYVRSADHLALTRITDSPAQDTHPIWTPDGVYLIFLSNRNNRWDLYKTTADGQGMAERLTTLPAREEDPALSPDGTRVAFTDALGRPSARIGLHELGSGTHRELLAGPVDDREPAWSPDGLWIAFSSRRPAGEP